MNERIKMLRNHLLSSKLDGMIVSNPINVRYMTGLSEEGFLIIAPKENIFVTDNRYIESVNRNLTIDDEIVTYNVKDLTQYDYESIFNESNHVGFEEKFVTYEQYKKFLLTYKRDLVETDGIIENLRISKYDDEIEKIKKACEITDKAYEYILENIKVGMTERDVAFEIEKFMLSHGAEDKSFDLIVAFGENTSMPHAVPSSRVVQKGDIVQIDIGCKYQGYCSDMSRVFFIEEMKEEYKIVYDFVLEQEKRLGEALKIGGNIKTIVKDREMDYNLKGYNILHAFGHGVGLEIHELPVLRSTKECILKENTPLAIEPGVYIPGKFGIRIEDTVLVEKYESKYLTNSSKKYQIVKLKK